MAGWPFFRAATSEEHNDAETRRAEEEVEEQKAEELFLAAMRRSDGKFDEAMSELDEVDDATAKRLLGWAAHESKSPDVLRKIGERCGDISGWTLEKRTAIQQAIASRNVRGARELLRMGVDVNSESGNASLSRAIHWAVYRASMPCVEALLEQAELEVDAPNTVGFTALHMCSLYAAEPHPDTPPQEVFAEIAAALIARGADINKESTAESDQVTPLAHAIDCRAFLIVEKMVELGKKPPARQVEYFLKELIEARVDGVQEAFAEAGWCPSVMDDANSRAAAALKDIENAMKAEAPPAYAAQQRSSGNRAAPRSPALHHAAKSGNVVVLMELLSSGADVNAVDKIGGTALHAAVMHGHDDVVEALLRADGVAIDKPDMSKVTALYRAAVANQVACVKALLKAGASPHAKDQRGLPLLHKVVAARPAGPVLEALLAAGASPGTGGEKGDTALHAACKAGTSGTVEALLRAGALPGHCWNDSLQSPLVVACRYGNLNAVQQLLPVLSKRQLNMRSGINAQAETALAAAIRCITLTMDTVAIVEALLEAGADPHARAGPSLSAPLALVLTTKTDFGAVNAVATHATIGPPLVKALVAGGAGINELVIDQCGMTPLQLACSQGACAEVMQALLDAGADILAPCSSIGFAPPLHLAAHGGGNLGAVRVLLKDPRSGGLNALGGPERDTPLVAAIQGGKIEVVRFLLEEGADMDLLPFAEDGKTPTTRSLIEMAASYGHVDIMRLLIQANMFKYKAEQQTEDAKAKEVEKAAALC